MAKKKVTKKAVKPDPITRITNNTMDSLHDVLTDAVAEAYDTGFCDGCFDAVKEPK